MDLRADSRGEFTVALNPVIRDERDPASVFFDTHPYTYIVVGNVSGVTVQRNQEQFTFGPETKVTTVQSALDNTFQLEAVGKEWTVYANPSSLSTVVAQLPGDELLSVANAESVDNELWWKVKLSDGNSGWVMHEASSTFYIDRLSTLTHRELGIKYVHAYLQSNAPDAAATIRLSPTNTGGIVARLTSTRKVKPVGSRIIDGTFWWHVELPDRTRGWIVDNEVSIVNINPEVASHLQIYAGDEGISVHTEKDACSPIIEVRGDNVLEISDRVFDGEFLGFQVQLPDGRRGWVWVSEPFILLQ